MTMSGVRLMAVALASCLLAARAAALHAAERPWLEVRSPHFVAVSDVGEKSARDALALARNEGERSLAQRTLDNYLKATAR